MSVFGPAYNLINYAPGVSPEVLVKHRILTGSESSQVGIE